MPRVHFPLVFLETHLCLTKRSAQVEDGCVRVQHLAPLRLVHH